MSKLIYFRADFSNDYGMGNINRSIILSNIFSKKGYTTKIISLIKENSKETFNFIDNNLNKNFIKINHETELMSYLKKDDVNCLILDLNEKGEYQELISYIPEITMMCKIICFDKFLYDSSHFFLRVFPFGDLKKSCTNILRGLKYHVFNQNVVAKKKLKKPLAKIKNVLVSMGGADPNMVTPEILKILSSNRELTFHCVIGPLFTKDNVINIKKVIDENSNCIAWHHPKNLSGLLLICDIAITSGGQTKFETSLYGLPTIILANNEQEEELSRVFEEYGSSYVYGISKNFISANFKNIFENFIKDKNKLIEMSKIGSNILDSKGGFRVVNAIIDKINN